MIINKVRIENFGPYFGDHEVIFNNNGVGVHIFRGGNGQGKTSFQNAILWALYGKVSDRKGKEIQKKSLLNFKAHSNGFYTYSVQIAFNHEGKNCILTRRTKSMHHTNKQYKENESLSLIRDGEIVPNPKNEIERILPGLVSRFFFFDGEMLRDYEELLDNTSSDAVFLKDAIERILGIPFFRIARNDMIVVKRRIEYERNKIIRKLGGDQYDDLVEQFEDVLHEIDQIQGTIDSLTLQKQDLEQQLKDNKRRAEDIKIIKENAELRNKLDGNIELCEEKLKIQEERIKKLNSNLYKTILLDISENILHTLDRIHEEKMAKYDKKMKLTGKLETILEGIKNSKCEYCGTILNEEKLLEFEKEKRIIESDIQQLTEVPEPDTSYDAYRQILRRMNQNLVDQTEYEDIETNINVILSEMSEHSRKLQDVKDKLLDVDEEEPFLLESKIRYQEGEIGRLGGLIEGKHNEMSEWMEVKSVLDQKMKSVDDDEMKILEKRISLLDSSIELFNTAILKYTEGQRNVVEKMATDIFKILRSKESFSRLMINENYGLSIVTTDGRILNRSEWRSAGEEQIVALALIGALNKCSQIVGPIMMDTPFGRLDLAHGEKVMSYLPSMADQIIIVATDRELRASDLEKIQDKIQSDYTIEYYGPDTGSKFRLTR